MKKPVVTLFWNFSKKFDEAISFSGMTQNRRQGVFTRGALRLWRGLDIENFIKSPMVYSVSYFDLGGLVLCLGGLSPPKPRGDETGMTFCLNL